MSSRPNQIPMIRTRGFCYSDSFPHALSIPANAASEAGRSVRCPDWIFELKYDGFRGLAVVENGRTRLLSRNGYPFASFAALTESISDSLPNVRAVIDGEICTLDWR